MSIRVLAGRKGSHRLKCWSVNCNDCGVRAWYFVPIWARDMYGAGITYSVRWFLEADHWSCYREHLGKHHFFAHLCQLCYHSRRMKQEQSYYAD